MHENVYLTNTSSPYVFEYVILYQKTSRTTSKRMFEFCTVISISCIPGCAFFGGLLPVASWIISPDRGGIGKYPSSSWHLLMWACGRIYFTTIWVGTWFLRLRISCYTSDSCQLPITILRCSSCSTSEFISISLSRTSPQTSRSLPNINLLS